ncbi:hypothetical protein [uncultured Gammaproteobacteria bacterium]|nr:hypothetical protein [uncultured Gammaproteobacteria bacterium]SHN93229.1 hypothetical protein BCLUESOX_427 [bacterium endosymbiont of Bathymodiolus sp. 5 South]VVH56021.1 hypothetical protein BSPCLSOX_1489 [uncultured Gammaproteobacteria bacterium]VVH63067.1 hypothetical protein BSPWISOX_1151 [uncultured Gammaproteobacteria bacterium]
MTKFLEQCDSTKTKAVRFVVNNPSFYSIRDLCINNQPLKTTQQIDL